MNNVILIGNLVREPELRFTPGSGKAVCNFTIAVPRGFKKDEADFIPVIVWDKKAENCANFLVKGSQVAVKGSIRTSNYQAQDGSKRYKTEVWADEVKFLGKKETKAETPENVGFFPVDAEDSDVPF